MNKSRGRGRPPGESTTRDDILAVARERFLRDGYDRVTMRSVAREAGVDVALISYHFGSKKGLFGAALALNANPAEVLERELAGPLNSLPERLVRSVVEVWEDRASGGSLRTLLEAAVRDPDVARLFREVAEREMIARIAERIGGADAARRASVAMSQIAGMVIARYVLELQPLAAMSADELAERMAPALRAALAGPSRSAPTR
jgi:AcrR family transcriptional regulator